MYTAVRYGDVGARKDGVKRLDAYFQESHGFAGRRRRGRPPAPENRFMTAAGQSVRRSVSHKATTRSSASSSSMCGCECGSIRQISDAHRTSRCLGTRSTSFTGTARGANRRAARRAQPAPPHLSACTANHGPGWQQWEGRQQEGLCSSVGRGLGQARNEEARILRGSNPYPWRRDLFLWVRCLGARAKSLLKPNADDSYTCYDLYVLRSTCRVQSPMLGEALEAHRAVPYPWIIRNSV